MKKTLYLVLLLISLQGCSGQLKCTDLKDGVFELKSETGTTIIDRNGSTQIEKSDGLSYNADVKWVSDCKYELTNHRNHRGELDKQELNSVYTVEIIEIKPDSIRIRTTSNYADLSVERTLRIVELK